MDPSKFAPFQWNKHLRNRFRMCLVFRFGEWNAIGIFDGTVTERRGHKSKASGCATIIFHLMLCFVLLTSIFWLLASLGFKNANGNVVDSAWIVCIC